MAVEKFNIDEWLKTGGQIASASRFYDRLTDMNGNNQPDFDNLFYFADDGKPDVVSLRTAINHLKRRAQKGVSDRELKEYLMTFIADSEILFANNKSIEETRQYLVNNHLCPDYEAIYDKRTGGGKTVNTAVYPSRWKRFNNWVAGIGDYFNSLREIDPDDIKGFLYLIVLVIMAIAVIITLVTDGLGSAIIAAIVCFLLMILIYFAINIIVWLFYPLMWILRYLFYNAWVLVGFTVLYTTYLFITV